MSEEPQDPELDPTNSAIATDQDLLPVIEQLGNVLARLEENPYDISLLQDQINLTKRLNMPTEMQQSILVLSNLVMLDESIWLTYFDSVIDPTMPLTIETLAEILERFDQAEADYLSANLLQKHADFVITASRTIDEEIQTFLSDQTTRTLLQNVVDKAGGLLSDSQLIWNKLLEWELEKNDSEQIHQAYLKRLSTPHIQLDETSSSYSGYCSKHCPEEYETRMVRSVEAVQIARRKLNEKRYGRSREDFESELTYAVDSDSTSRIYQNYIEWEVDQRSRFKRNNKAPSPDSYYVSSVFERAISHFGNRAGTMPEASVPWTLKEGESLLWGQYIDWKEENQDPASLVVRACKACPQSSALFGAYVLSLEGQAADETVLQEAFDKMLAMGGLTKTSNPIDEVAEVFIQYAGYESRKGVAEEGARRILDIIERGLSMIDSISETGDPSLRLEQFLLRWAETQAVDQLDAALAIFNRPSKTRAASHLLVKTRASIAERRGAFEAARILYQTAIQRSDLDWPEAIFEAYLLFEQIHGTLESLRYARKCVLKETVRVAKRREKAFAEAAPVMDPDAVEVVAKAAETDAAEDKNDNTAISVANGHDEPSHLKRDREHSQVLVTGMQPGTVVGRVEAFFADCGTIREIIMLPGAANDAALVEFRFVDDVPNALAKDQKKLDTAVISVSMLWRSTIWVTNMSRDADDAEIRQLFSQYGSVLHTRWPSRKYGENRRFCYVTMESPVQAQDALHLHGSKNADGFGLTVKISDPSNKAVRTDAQTTVFVGGLPAKTSEEELQELFSTCGTVKRIRLGWDPIKQTSKGFAFVEMGSDAEVAEAVRLHGSAFNNRILRVVVSDPDHAKKKSAVVPQSDKRDRTARLHNLPPKTQEGLLQQALEKIVPVKRLELFAKTHEAVVELNNPADFGKLSLQPFIYEGQVIEITDGRRRIEVKEASALDFAPRNARKPAKSLGRGRQAPATDRTLPPTFVTTQSHGQDDFRAIVDAKNRQREGKLVNAISRGKRQQDHEEEGDNKRSRTG